jgi:glycosyltransferase involved in cell wall biosynthesis
MNSCLITIIVVCYNSEKYIEQTINSCLCQKYDNYEILISDDNSTDKTWELISRYSNPKICAFRQERNLTEYSNRNFCINRAKGDYIIFIDGEDILYPYALTVLNQYILQYPDAAQFIAREWDEKMIYPIKINPFQFAGIEFLGRGVTAKNFTRVLFKKKCLLEKNCFDRNDIKIGDVYMQYKLGLYYTSVLISEGFSWWRRRNGQASEQLLLNGFNYFSEYAKFKVQMICTYNILNEKDKRIALNNFYGNILRYLIKEIFRFRFTQVFKFLRKVRIPKKYLTSIFVKPSLNYLEKYNGENPLSD